MTDAPNLDEVVRFVEAEMHRTEREATNQDIDAAVEKIGGGDAFKDIPRKVIRRLAISHAFDNAGFEEAFKNRGEDPAAWDAAVDNAQVVLADEVKGLAPGLPASTGDGDGPSAAQMSNMSDAEWDSFVQEELAKAS